MPTLRSKLPLAATVVAVTALGAGAASPMPVPSAPETPAEVAAVLLSMTGQWEGSLEYRDYQSDERVTLPAARSAESSAIGPFLFQGLAFVDPGRRVESFQIIAMDEPNAVSLIMMTEEGIVRETYEIREAVIRDPMNSWKFVLQRIGTDDHRAADIRLTQTLQGGVLAARKDVRYHDVGTWEFRNETRFERKPADPKTLVGVWRVDMRPTPDAPPHYAELVVDAVEDGRIRGTFYGSPIRDGSVNVHWGELQFAFISDDGSGAYYTSGISHGGRISGRTHSAHRQFLSVWQAHRREM